jgi:hypothetical protein
MEWQAGEWIPMERVSAMTEAGVPASESLPLLLVLSRVERLIEKGTDMDRVDLVIVRTFLQSYITAFTARMVDMRRLVEVLAESRVSIEPSNN